MTRTYISGLFSLRFTFSALFFYFSFYYQVHQTFYNNIYFLFYFQVLNLLHSLFYFPIYFQVLGLLHSFFFTFQFISKYQAFGAIFFTFQFINPPSRGWEGIIGMHSVCLSATLMVLPYNLVTRIKAILWTCFKV